MPQVLSSREELKKDPLQEAVRRALDWIENNRQTFFSVAGTLLVVVAVAAFIFANLRNLRNQAWDKYSGGQNAMIMQNWDGALGLFDDVINNYARTPASAYALLSKGDVLYQKGDYAGSIASYKLCLEKNPPRILLPLLLISMGTAQEDAADYASAIESYKRFTSEFPDHYLAPKAYESLGRAYEASLNADAAKGVYEKIITLFPGTPWAETARLRYQAISPAPFQGEPAAQK